MEASCSHCPAPVATTDTAVNQLAARLVSDYLQTEGCKKAQQHFHLESPIKSLFTHSCAQCTSPCSLLDLLKDYYRLQAIVNHGSEIQAPSVPQCKTSIQIVRASTNRRKRNTRVDQLACIPLHYTSNGVDEEKGCSSNGPGMKANLESLCTQIERHEKTIKNLVQCANMQQKTLQTLVLNSLGGQKDHVDQIRESPTRKRKNETPQIHSTKKRSVTTGVGENTEADRDEHMTQLIDTILNDQSLLDKLVNYINQSLDQPTDSDASAEDQNLIDSIRTSDVADNVMRLTESDPQFETLMDKWK